MAVALEILLLLLIFMVSSSSCQKAAPSPKSPPNVAPGPKSPPTVAPPPNSTAPSPKSPPNVAPGPKSPPNVAPPPNSTAPSPKPPPKAAAPAPKLAAAPSIAPSSPNATQPSPAPSPPKNNGTSPTLAPTPVPSPSPSSNLANGTLDPSQISALDALKVPVGSNPCAGSHSTMICDEGTPFRRLIFLQLQYCPANASLSDVALKNLTGLQALSFFDCPMKPAAFLPASMVASLTSFSCVSSLGRTSGFEDMPGLSGVWLSKLHKVQDLTVMDVIVNASSLSVIMSNMTDLQELRITNASLRGTLPKTWPENLTIIDLSLNNIQGGLPSFFGELQQLQSFDLTGNNLTGRLPDSLGRLRNLQKFSVSSNGLSGSIPAAALANMTSLNYLDLSGNRFNGTIPDSLAELVDLRYLDLRNNQLRGILPFNSSFLARLNSFKASGNPALCYNSSRTSSKVITGLPPCDDTGNPISSVGPALAPGEDLGPIPQPETGKKTSKKRGPKTIVWAVATALGAIFLFIALVVIFSKWCRWKEA